MNKENKNDLRTWAVRAGKRTYFFDVKATRGKDLFITITESKRVEKEGEDSHFEKHKIFLFKEDFENFQNGFENAVAFIHELQGTDGYRNAEYNRNSSTVGTEDQSSEHI